MSKPLRYLLTALVVLASVSAVGWKYRDYILNPWTRNGQVTADVLQVVSRVSGPIIELPIVDNQLVKRGDLLFRVDPRTYQAAVDQANARLDATRDQLKNLGEQVKAAQAAVAQSESRIKQAQFAVARARANLDEAQKDLERATNLLPEGAVSRRTFDQANAAVDIAQADLANAEAQEAQATSARLQAEAELARTEAQLGAPGEKNAQLREAKAALESARLNLEFTEVRASVDGYVTNLTLRLGSQAVANQPILALIDTSSFYARGFFRENVVGRVRPGMPALVIMMTYPDQPVTGRVESVGWGIYQDDGSSGPDLLPRIKPTFEWIRLAQRVPVRIRLESVPDGVDLRVGTTASVLVMTGDGNPTEAPPVPAALQ